MTMGLFDFLYPYTTPEPLDDIDEGFASGLLTRWDIPWGVPDEEKDAHLLGLLDERKKEGWW
jgi:hypothetical protein